MRRQACIPNHGMFEAVGLQIQALDECVNEADRILSAEVFIWGFEEKEQLVPVRAFDVV